VRAPIRLLHIGPYGVAKWRAAGPRRSSRPLASGAQAGDSVFLAAMTVPHDQGMPLVPLSGVISKGFTYLFRLIRGGLSRPDP
jgi:hypothetical protein